MNDLRKSVGLGALALVPIACCIGLPLLVAAGVGAATFAWIGVAGAGVVAAGAMAAWLVRRGGRAADCCVTASGPLVEVLYFDGCPNHEPAVALIERVARDLSVRPEIRLVNVPDPESAAALRFLGSPTVRVGGRDVEPGADERADFALTCRVFRTDAGFSGEPDEQWIRDALLREAAVPA